MIKQFIDVAENLNPSEVERLSRFYDDNATFIHPFKTVHGKKAIIRQWKMSFKYCPSTTIRTANIKKYINVDCTVYTFDWQHCFLLPSGKKKIKGITTVVVSPEEMITLQLDVFNLHYYNTLFHHDSDN